MEEKKAKKPFYKRWYMIVLYIFIGLGIIGNLINSPGTGTSTKTPTETTTVKEEAILVTKSLSEMFPTREEIPTEFTMGELRDAENLANAVGFESGKHLGVSKLEGYSGIIIVKMDIYKFSSAENARVYYETKVNEIKQKGGYSDMSISAKATCFGYTKDYGFSAMFANGMCYKNNIFFLIGGTSSNTFEKSDSYVKNIIKIIDKKIN